jgi:hypothetical protein
MSVIRYLYMKGLPDGGGGGEGGPEKKKFKYGKPEMRRKPGTSVWRIRHTVHSAATRMQAPRPINPRARQKAHPARNDIIKK